MATVDVGISVRHFKAFGEEAQGFDRLKPVNVIIGRNNSGKSTLIDMVEAVCASSTFKDAVKLSSAPGRLTPEVWVEQTMGQLMGDDVPGQVAHEYMRNYYHSEPAENWREVVGRSSWPDYREFWQSLPIRWSLGPNGTVSLVDAVPQDIRGSRDMAAPAVTFLTESQRRGLPLSPSVPIAGRHFHRLAADRSIRSETFDKSNLVINPHGVGATNVLSRFVTDLALPRGVVEDKLLSNLNKVFHPDARFTGIQVQRLEEDKYEVFLDEVDKGPVALSSSGSGLQTVILVLASLDVLPHVPGSPSELNRWVFAFEELENNLHPALQRRLFWLLRERAVEEDSMVFITTHSPVVVDLFAEDDEAQLVHVTHDGKSATATAVFTYASRRDVLDDLDVRASDLLQSNVVVWVEGPTDRMYFNHWVRLWTDGDLREGKDYQCVFYGGRLLNHLSADEPGGLQREAVEILRVNRNAVVLMDSDKKKPGDRINPTKRRLRDEVKKGGGVEWVTQGREVEHYISPGAFERFAGKKLTPLGQFDDVLKYLNSIQDKEGRKGYDKVKFAEAIIPHIDRADLEGLYDMAPKLDAVCAAIRKWNRRPAPAPRPLDSAP